MYKYGKGKKIYERGKDFQNKLYEEAEKVKACLNNNVPNYIYANVTLNSQIELQKNLAENYLNYLDKENSSLGNYLFKIIFQTADKLVDLINNLYPKIEENNKKFHDLYLINALKK